MNDLLNEMLTHYEITKVLNEYCHGCDRLDQVRMAGVYCEDSWDDHGRRKCQGKEFARQCTESLGAAGGTCSHLLGQSLIDVRGEEAGAETYFLASLTGLGDDGIERLHQIGGRYVDTLVKEDGGWKIKHRICVRDWSASHKIEEDALNHPDFVQGKRSDEDPSFAVLRLTHSGIPGIAPAKREEMA